MGTIVSNPSGARSAVASLGGVFFSATQAGVYEPPPPPSGGGNGGDSAHLPSAPTSTSTLYFHTDALGSVRRVTDQNQTVVETRDYLPFGQEYNPPAVVAGNTLRFTGKERDNETEVQAQALHPLDYFGARYYQGQIGRFTSVDPDHVSGTVVDPQSWNGYSYGRNNPLRFTDPDGQRFEICVDEMIGCSSVTDDEFRRLQQNPGAGIRLADGKILVSGRKVEPFNRRVSIRRSNHSLGILGVALMRG